MRLAPGLLIGGSVHKIVFQRDCLIVLLRMLNGPDTAECFIAVFIRFSERRLANTAEYCVFLLPKNLKHGEGILLAAECGAHDRAHLVFKSGRKGINNSLRSHDLSCPCDSGYARGNIHGISEYIVFLVNNLAAMEADAYKD